MPVYPSDVFIVVWSGGLEPPQYEAEWTEESAMALARSWWADADQEVDQVDVLRLDLESLTFERVEPDPTV